MSNPQLPAAAPAFNLRELLFITISGAVGGLLAWLISQTSAGPDKDWYFTLPIAVLGGFLAAGVGVYVLANTNTSNMQRAIFFAVLCGISWKPILETGKNLVTQATTDKNVVTNSGRIETGVRETKEGASAQDIQKLKDSTIQIAQSLPDVTNREVKQDGRTAASAGIKHLRFLSSFKPAESVNALKEIGTSAGASGNLNIKAEVLEQLTAISNDPQHPPAQAEAAKAISALK